jgi:hypothetical protein
MRVMKRGDRCETEGGGHGSHICTLPIDSMVAEFSIASGPTTFAVLPIGRS